MKLEVHPFERKDEDRLEYLLPVKDLGLPARYEKPWGGRKLPVYVYKTDHDIIWGITAEILRDFLNRYEQPKEKT